ncbi:MAG: hypothetical protein ABR599_07440 [Gemmatimonadota bacterium]
MNVRFAWVVLIALFVTALPAAAQQDTSAAGRTGEGVTDRGPAAQPPAADTTLTTRQGIEGDVTDPAATTQEREMDDDMGMDDEGGAMPRTASGLPAIALTGGMLALLGIGLRLASGRRS